MYNQVLFNAPKCLIFCISFLGRINRQAGARKRCLYIHDNLCRAVQAVKDSRLSVRQAAASYGVPRSTISEKIFNKTSLDKCAPGPNTVLSHEEEEHLAKWAI